VAVDRRSSAGARAKNSSSFTFTGRAEELQHLERAAAGFDTLAVNAPPATAPYPPVVIRGLALAALAVLGEAGDDNAARIEPIVGAFFAMSAR